MSQADLARLWRLSPTYISDLVSGYRSITNRVALRLEATFSMPASYWLDLERECKLGQEAKLLRSELARIKRELPGNRTLGYQ